MSDLISRAALLSVIKGLWNVLNDPEARYALSHVNRFIEVAPAVDAEPVRHGRYGFVGPHIGWLCLPYAEHGTCNACKERILIDPNHKNYCPNCGAKIDKEGDT